ncbi:MAG: DUF3892 domain-containing protein [Akkermansia muciniphila]|uniref:DUF3892 domain-containing protein n=1 Tax=uncultured Akkermansia sp. TaxID=512294 RepID=UPI00263461A7|nr:DUF3892 domain-containing protein [uncultured Akkermansia sp.]
MIKTTKIRLKPGCTNPKSALEIDQIYLVGVNHEGFYDKTLVHDFVKKGNIVHVDISPHYPKLIDAISSRGEKYVRSEPNDTPNDNLLRLPRV